MFGADRSYLLPTVLAVGLHAVLGYLVAGSWFEGERQHRVQPFRHVKAELVDLRSQTKAQQEADDARQKAEQQRKADARKRAQDEQRQKDKAAAEKKRKAEAERKKQEAATRQKKAEAEKKRQQDLARKRKAEEKAKAVAKAKQEAELARKREAETKAKAERERQEKVRRQQELERIEREAAAELARIETAKQQAEAAATRRAAEQEMVASAVSVIRDGIQRNWRRPPSARNGMLVGVRIHLLPTGEVDDAYVVKSSGDDAFDRSAVNAVLKAERFPELKGLDPALFDRNLRQINLEFRPEDLRL